VRDVHSTFKSSGTSAAGCRSPMQRGDHPEGEQSAASEPRIVQVGVGVHHIDRSVSVSVDSEPVVLAAVDGSARRDTPWTRLEIGHAVWITAKLCWRGEISVGETPGVLAAAVAEVPHSACSAATFRSLERRAPPLPENEQGWSKTK